MNKRPSELLFKHLRRVWQYRRNLLRTSIIGLVAGLFISLSLPNEYEVAVFASAESTLASASDGLEGLPLEGIYAGKKIQDALLPSLYPQIVGSSAFLLPLFPIPVQPVSCPPDSTVTLYEYMDSHQRHPWWNILSSLFHKFDSQPVKDERIASDISSRITINIDKDKRTISITTRMQDPQVAYTLADTVCNRIQALITDYRTQKERDRLSHAQEQHRQAREKYYHAQEAEAQYQDTHRDLYLKTAQQELVKLQIKKLQARDEYIRTALEVHTAQIRVVRQRPVFAVIEPPTVPVRPASPSRLKYMAGFALLGFLAGYFRVWSKRMSSPLGA